MAISVQIRYARGRHRFDPLFRIKPVLTESLVLASSRLDLLRHRLDESMAMSNAPNVEKKSHQGAALLENLPGMA